MYNINNGILTVVSADALFDKTLITIDKDGTILFAYLIEQDYKLRSNLLLYKKF